MRLYLAISHQNNYEKMEKSIDNLLDIKTNAIYTHFSRIKTTFNKMMYHKHAENYCICTNKDIKDLNYRYIPAIVKNPFQAYNELHEEWYS